MAKTVGTGDGGLHFGGSGPERFGGSCEKTSMDLGFREISAFAPVFGAFGSHGGAQAAVR